MPKIKRMKRSKKILNFYQNNFGIIAPYTVLIDGTFSRTALMSKINIQDQIPKYLDAEVNLATTKCCLAECEALGMRMHGALRILQQYELKQCPHETAKPACHCILHTARKNKYFIATQDTDLKDRAREKGGIPILYISHNTPLLENPSRKSEKKAAKDLTEQLAGGDFQQERLKKLKMEEFGEEEEQTTKKRKKKGGPNPLSCKKKKKVKSSGDTLTVIQDNTISDKKRKRRKRNKLSSHVKEHLVSLAKGET